MHGQNLGVKEEVVVQLGREKAKIGLANSETLILDIIDDDLRVVLDLIEDGLVKLHVASED